MFKVLLAKSLSQQEKEEDRARGAAKYTGHISFVMQAADVLVDKLGLSILQQLGIEHIDLGYFATTVRLGAYLHDWGKANQHFQEMVYLKTLDPKSPDPKLRDYRKQILALSKKHSDKQMLRHEVISGILALQVPSFRKWLEQCPNSNLMIAVWAAMGHHLKIGINKNNQPAEFIAEIPSSTGDNLKIYTHHSDFQAVLKMGHQVLGLPESLPEAPQEIWSKSQLQEALINLRDEFIQFESQLDWEQQKFIAAVKATVIAADLAGSALPLAEEDFKVWIEQVLTLQLSKEEVQKLVNQRLQGKKLRRFQKQIAQSARRVTLVVAGCGTGKTISAYAWGEKWAVGRRLFFSYPTTGTASQGYIDYADGTEIETALMHSRADLDRELLFSGDSDDAESIDARLMAFQAWRKKLIVCTVDSVLGLIQNNRKPLYSWAAIAQSAFVFDEVHAYDARLFGALLKFIKAFRGAPILLMSASFTPEQLRAIRQVLAEQGEELDEPIEGPKELEELKRYEIKYIPEVADLDELKEIWQPAIEALRNKQKVLWVTNSVPTCIEIYRTAKIKLAEQLPELSIEPLIYHSRYRYKDRLKKHKAVIEAFNKDEPVLAITTQVCEMSLDLSADLLISAMAPAASLIQRLGRLNRRMTRQEEGTRLAIIYPWDNKRPYDTAELSTGEQLIQEFSGKTGISQRDLAEVAARLHSEKVEQVKSSWLEENWCNRPDFLREGGYTITVLLGEDEEKAIWDIAEQRRQELLKQGKNESLMKLFKQEAQAWSVPIQIEPDYREWQRRGFYPITPKGRIRYSKEVGAEQ
ncbi:MAG: CRISPR-associated helicase Cas3' [Iphinoe sp. HA4291-MV1]|jgi:CRISPR-associated endonuclease/helicase Cas3|nr:CRISPR-associated helicase Cas3' [Iphinoe sp. HA4291-MV1]